MELSKIPQPLLNIKNPVKKLFFKGDLTLLERFKIAIVGSRRPSQYTKLLVSKLASEISKRGGVVVSGGAMGVDALAHQGAGSQTIGVFANSLDLIYPKTSKKIIEDIYSNALALSEYQETTEPRAYHFVQRNRIVTALSDVVIIAQGDLKSGSMRSAQFAYEQKKPLYVFPHRLGESLGTNSLLLEKKAKAILDIDIFLDDLGLEKKESKGDELLEFCESNNSYEAVVKRFKERVFEYELEGKIEIINGTVIVKS